LQVGQDKNKFAIRNIDSDDLLPYVSQCKPLIHGEDRHIFFSSSSGPSDIESPTTSI